MDKHQSLVTKNRNLKSSVTKSGFYNKLSDLWKNLPNYQNKRSQIAVMFSVILICCVIEQFEKLNWWPKRFSIWTKFNIHQILYTQHISNFFTFFNFIYTKLVVTVGKPFRFPQNIIRIHITATIPIFLKCQTNPHSQHKSRIREY